MYRESTKGEGTQKRPSQRAFRIECSRKSKRNEPSEKIAPLSVTLEERSNSFHRRKSKEGEVMGRSRDFSPCSTGLWGKNKRPLGGREGRGEGSLQSGERNSQDRELKQKPTPKEGKNRREGEKV